MLTPWAASKLKSNDFNIVAYRWGGEGEPGAAPGDWATFWRMKMEKKKTLKRETKKETKKETLIMLTVPDNAFKVYGLPFISTRSNSRK